MVKTVSNEKSALFVCEECRLVYPDKEWAEKCESWCRTHHTCNIEITKHSWGPERWRDSAYPIRAKYARAYDSWSAEEDETLRKEFARAVSAAVKEMMAKHGRTRGAIHSRLKKLDLIKRFPVFKPSA